MEKIKNINTEYEKMLTEIKGWCEQFRDEFSKDIKHYLNDQYSIWLLQVMEKYLHDNHNIYIRYGAEYFYGYKDDRLIHVVHIDNDYLTVKFEIVKLMVEYVKSPF
jgi:hypothetical protein